MTAKEYYKSTRMVETRNWTLEMTLNFAEEYAEALRKNAVSGEFPTDDRIVVEAIQAARKFDTELGLLPSNNDIEMFSLGAKWMRDLVQGSDR